MPPGEAGEMMMGLPDRLKLKPRFSVRRLQADLDGLKGSEWIGHFVRENYEGDWDVLPLRGPSGAEHPVRMAYSDPGCDRFADTPFLHVCPYFREILQAFPFELHAVRLMALAPGSRIKEHRDHDLSLEDGAIRLHIPIRTNEDVVFTLNGSRVGMGEGECWYLRLSDPHAVYNGGVTSRVHLVVDAPVGPGVPEFLLSGGQGMASGMGC